MKCNFETNEIYSAFKNAIILIHLTTFLKIMKKIVLITAILSSFTIVSQAQKTKTTGDATASKATGESFTVTLKSPSYKSGLTYLCYHMGKNLNIEDSTYFNEQGVAVFKGDRKLMGGIYAVVFPGKNLTFDFFVDREQNLSIYADSTDLQNVKITGSTANDLFQLYQKFVGSTGMMMQKERLAYNASTTKADSALHLEKYNKFNKELIDFRDKLMKENPESMMASMLNAMREPEVLNKEPKTRQDTLDNYYYYKQHYWDGVSFTDDRVIRTPFFLPKLERYYREILQQAPDSIIKDLDYKLLLARVSPEMYKFLLNWFTDEYINPKYMGQDAVFVHLFEKYHSKGVSSWLNEKQQETISRRAYMQMSNLIGVKAANLEMIDSTGKPKPLYDLNAEYTLVMFWDPTCGHCKEEIPRIDSIYRASWKAKGVRVYSVLSDNDKKKEWVDYLKEHKLGDWTNVYETKEMEKAVNDAQRPGFRQLYDVTQTPTILLLDKEKRIVGKKLSWEQLNDFLETKWKEKK
jgi:thiol-disulfide isomerase/thioredoxin